MAWVKGKQGNVFNDCCFLRKGGGATLNRPFYTYEFKESTLASK